MDCLQEVRRRTYDEPSRDFWEEQPIKKDIKKCANELVACPDGVLERSCTQVWTLLREWLRQKQVGHY